MILVDSHAHLDDKQFDCDREEIIKDLKSNDISFLINIGSDLDSSVFSKHLAEKYDFIYFTAGIHPHDSKDCTEEVVTEIEKMLHHPKCAALGEIGLDYFKNYSEKSIQKDIFEKQLIIAKKVNIPICVHMREATKDTVDLLKKYYPNDKAGVIHSFSASKETAKIMLDMGFYLSISGPVTYSNAVNVKDIASYIPIDRLLIETDCPYLTPVPKRGRRNEPKYIKYTAIEIARIKRISFEDVAQATKKNAFKLFDIKPPQNNQPI